MVNMMIMSHNASEVRWWVGDRSGRWRTASLAAQNGQGRRGAHRRIAESIPLRRRSNRRPLVKRRGPPLSESSASTFCYATKSQRCCRPHSFS